MIQIEEKRWDEIRAELTYLRSLEKLCYESNKSIDTYLRTIYPQLPMEYGMPVDGVRIIVEYLQGIINRKDRSL